MALLSASLAVGGVESGRLEVARREGESVSAAIASAKQQLLSLVNAEVAKAEGAAAAAEGERGARARPRLRRAERVSAERAFVFAFALVFVTWSARRRAGRVRGERGGGRR